MNFRNRTKFQDILKWNTRPRIWDGGSMTLESKYSSENIEWLNSCSAWTQITDITNWHNVDKGWKHIDTSQEGKEVPKYKTKKRLSSNRQHHTIGNSTKNVVIVMEVFARARVRNCLNYSSLYNAQRIVITHYFYY